MKYDDLIEKITSDHNDHNFKFVGVKEYKGSIVLIFESKWHHEVYIKPSIIKDYCFSIYEQEELWRIVNRVKGGNMPFRKYIVYACWC